MLLSDVLAFLPKCASKGVIFKVAIGVTRCVLIRSATSDASLYGLFVLWIFIIASLIFKILVSLSTIPIDLWSFTGAIISLILLLLQDVMNFWSKSLVLDRIEY